LLFTQEIIRYFKGVSQYFLREIIWIL